jgi:hypothetical protein
VGRLESLTAVFDFFVPADVLSSVLLVFTMENVLGYFFSAFIPEKYEVVGWIAVYLIGMMWITATSYLTATDLEREELSDDLEEL